MAVLITVETFTKALEEAVAERGADYVYPVRTPTAADPTYVSGSSYEDDDWHNSAGQCMYSTRTGEPACIIGLAVSKLGGRVPVYGEVFSASELLGDEESFKFESEFDFGRIGEAADRAQDEQDTGKTWGIALARFKTEVGL